jgi:sodium transport system ATP-binding protein
MIQVQELSKTFTDPKRGTQLAVDRVSFDVRAGEVFGLLGPNGAGKTTTLRLLGTLLKPTSGTATLDGFDINTAPGKVRAHIGFLSGDMGLYARLTPREILEFYGRLNEMSTERRQKRIAELFALLDMSGFADVRTDKLSTGMKQKTAIARTMLHDPPILILDEPSSGLDVPTARTIESAIMAAKKSGKCIIYSTHVMEEAEYLCDRIGVISGGRLKITGTMDELRAATGKHRLREIFLDLLGLPQDQ